ncbi:MAG: hypothetical protein KDI62_02975 [Anaerolineae bacterium]|nr:hypothetical protein [Anaerolineae bacterium]MCB9104184.1 hypothetical protein [Anaerolineales bacterium]
MDQRRIFVIGLLLLVTCLACSYSFSTAKITGATLARDASGEIPTVTFSPDDTFYFVVDLANAPDDTVIKAAWTAIDAGGNKIPIDEARITSGSGLLTFDLSSEKLWPVGNYQVELFVNNDLAQTQAFEVKAPVVAAAPTATPAPEPTITPEAPTTEQPQTSLSDSVSINSGSAGDSLAGQIEQGAVLQFQDTPYVHPSGAFSLPIPIGWAVTTESDHLGEFGDGTSVVGVEFIDEAQEWDETGMAQFIDRYLANFFSSQSYEEVAHKDQPDGSIYVAVTFESESGQVVDSDFFFEQRDTVVFILYLSTVVYDEINATWNEIIGGYQVNPQAVRPATPSPIPPTVTRAPPTPTTPTVNPFTPPPGVARVYLQNFYTNEYNIDFGDGQGSLQVMPGAVDSYHDLSPGRYNPGLSLPGGGASNVQFEIGPNQAWLIVVDKNAKVSQKQVYP